MKLRGGRMHYVTDAEKLRDGDNVVTVGLKSPLSQNPQNDSKLLN